MRSLTYDTNGSVVPVILFVLTIFGCGALYTLLFLEIGIPLFEGYIPASAGKTVIMMIVYAVPLFVIVIGTLALFINGLKTRQYYMGGGGL